MSLGIKKDTGQAGSAPVERASEHRLPPVNEANRSGANLGPRVQAWEARQVLAMENRECGDKNTHRSHGIAWEEQEPGLAWRELGVDFR